jgi:cytochrome c2
MAATDKALRDQKRLDIVFAVSSILMLISIVMMYAQDYFREFKNEQRVFRDVESRLAQRLALDQIPDAEEVTTAEAAVEKAKSARAAQYSKVDELKKEVVKLRPEKEKLDAKVNTTKADLESITSFLNIEVDRNGSSTKQAQIYATQVEELTLRLDDITAKRDEAASKISEKQSQIDAIDEPLTKALGSLKKVNDKFDATVKLAVSKRWTWQDSFRSLWLIEAFASPTKIHQITNNDYLINYNFKDVTRFDRCMTCHMGIDRPAYTKANLHTLLENTQEQKDKLNAAGAMLKKRHEVLSGLPEAKQLPSVSDLRLTTIADNRLTEARINEFAAHPRLDLFVGANSKHPAEKFGCTTCHAGQGSSTSFLWASHSPNDSRTEHKWTEEHGWYQIHAGDWEFPMLPKRFTESSCLKCHHQVTDLISSTSTKEAPKLLRGFELIQQNGCFGCHEIAGRKSGKAVGPDLRLEANPPLEDLNPSERARIESDPDNRPGNYRKVGPSLYRWAEKSNPEFTAKWIRAPREFRPDTKMPHFYGLSNNSADVLRAEYEKKKELAKDDPKLKNLEIVNEEKFPDVEIQAITYFLFEKSKEFVGDIKEQAKKDTAAAAAQDQIELMSLYVKGKLEYEERQKLDQITRRMLLRKAKTLGDLTDGYAGEAKKGRQLFVERGCLACHSHEATEKAEGGPAVASEAQFGPNLSQVAEKLGAKAGDKASAQLWLVQWVLDPKVHSPRSRMPVTHLTPHEAADVAAWLLNQPGADHGPGWDKLEVAPADVKTLEQLARVYLVRQLTKASLESFFTDKKLPAEIAKDLPVDEKEFVLGYATGGERALKMFVGKKAVGRQGCYACHDIPGFDNTKPIGVGLNDWGKKDASRLAFEDIERFVEHHYYAVPSLVDEKGKPYGPSKEKAHGEGHGAAKTSKLPMEKFFFDQLKGHDATRVGYLNQKLQEPRSYDYNRIRAWDDRARMPQFRFARLRKHKGESDADYQARSLQEEALAREAVMTFILGLTGEAAPEKMLNQPKGDRLAEVRGRQVLDAFNCAGCHLVRPGEFELKYDRVEEMLTKLAKAKAANEHSFPGHHSWTGPPQDNPDKITVHGIVPQPFIPDEENEEETRTVRLRTMEALRFQSRDKITHDLPAATSLVLQPRDFVTPSPAIADSTAALTKYLHTKGPFGGTFGDLLVGYFEKLDPKKYPRDVGIGDSQKARPLVPPSLVGLGEKGQPEWIYNFVLDPQPIRKMTVLRMPKFSLSTDDAKALADYFAGVERLRNPGVGLTYPFEMIGVVNEGYLRQKSAEYVARLKSAKVSGGAAGKNKTMFDLRVEELTPVWKEQLRDWQARKKTADANLDKTGKKLKDAQSKEKDAKDALETAKKDAKAKDKLADAEKKYDSVKGDLDEATRLNDAWEREAKELGDKIESGSVEKQKQTWMEREAYLSDGYKLVANKTLCIQCHSIGAYETKNETQGPRLDEVYRRLRPYWTEHWIAIPERHLPYGSSMPPYFENNPPAPKFQEFFVGTPREQIQAVRDVLMAYPQASHLPANRYWTLPLLGDVK